MLFLVASSSGIVLCPVSFATLYDILIGNYIIIYDITQGMLLRYISSKGYLEYMHRFGEKPSETIQRSIRGNGNYSGAPEQLQEDGFAGLLHPPE